MEPSSRSNRSISSLETSQRPLPCFLAFIWPAAIHRRTVAVQTPNAPATSVVVCMCCLMPGMLSHVNRCSLCWYPWAAHFSRMYSLGLETMSHSVLNALMTSPSAPRTGCTFRNASGTPSASVTVQLIGTGPSPTMSDTTTRPLSLSLAIVSHSIFFMLLPSALRVQFTVYAAVPDYPGTAWLRRSLLLAGIPLELLLTKRERADGHRAPDEG